MGRQTIATSSNPKIWIRVGGDLVLRGWERNEINFESGDIDSTRFQQVGDVLQIETPEDCRLSVPVQASVEVDKVGSDAVIRDVTGSVSVRKVGGDAEMRGIGTVTIERVGGDLALEQIAGDVSVEKVGGDVGVDGIKGRLSVSSSGGDLELNAVQSVRAVAGGDVSLDLETLDPQGYEIRAGGDFHCSLPDNVSLELELEAGSHEMQLCLPGLITTIEKRYLRQSVGQGGAPMKVKAGGDIEIACPSMEGQRTKFGGSVDSSFNFDDLDNLGERISRQVEEGLRTADFSAKLTSEMTSRTEAITQRALQQAQERIQAAMQRLEQRGMPEAGTPSEVEFASADNVDDQQEPVSDEERMIILQMLEEKKISVDEAQRLLNALEGGD